MCNSSFDKERLDTSGIYDRYAEWVGRFDVPNEADRAAIREKIRRADRSPLFSVILLPVGLEDPSLVLASVRSLRRQLYPHWQLWLPDVSAKIDLTTDSRIRLLSSPLVSNVVDWFNTALADTEGDFILPLPWDARLAETSLYELWAAIVQFPEVDLFYSDEDKIDADGTRCAPYFKTGWDPDLALGRDAIGLLVAYRKVLLEQLGGMRQRATGVDLNMYDLSLRAAFSVMPQRIHHIPAVLCHRHTNTEPTPDWDAVASRRIVRELLADQGVHAAVEPAPLAPSWNRIIREIPAPPPLVSVIILTRDHAELLGPCVQSLFSLTDYPNVELIIIDNDSRDPAAIELLDRLSQDQRVRILPYRHTFNFAAQNNLGVQEAKGEILVLLNNDIQVIGPDWLREMVSHAVRPDVGAVGAKLIYPSNRIQHAGLVLGPDPAPQHQLRFAERREIGPFGELALTRTVSAVTGACLALRRAVFFEAGGLDERLRVMCNDIDLCLRIGDCGYRVVWTPFAELLHLEMASRGPDDSPEKQALAAEEARQFWRIWGSLRNNDPYHNPNLRYGWDTVSLSWPPRLRRPWLE